MTIVESLGTKTNNPPHEVYKLVTFLFVFWDFLSDFDHDDFFFLEPPLVIALSVLVRI